MNDYFNYGGSIEAFTRARAEEVGAQFTAISEAFDRLPPPPDFAGNIGQIGTNSEVEASNISMILDVIQTTGFAVAGDGGAARYKRAAAEPAHDGKIQSLDGAWWEHNENWIIPDTLGSVHGADDSLALLRARDLALTRGAPMLLPAGVYTLSETMDWLANMHLIVMPGARLRATEGFAGDSMIRPLGDAGSYAENWSLSGGGTLDCANNVDIGIEIHRGRFSEIEQLRIFGANLSAVQIGDAADASPSYQVDIDRVFAYYNDVANAAESRAFYHANATDCRMSKVHSVGYRRGFAQSVTASSIRYNLAHAWARPAHRAMTHGFDLQGGGSVVVDGYADTPFHLDDAAADLYGYLLHGFSPRLIGCGVFMNTVYPGTDIASDGRIDAFHADREIFGTIAAPYVSGGNNVDKRYKSFFGGFRETSALTNPMDGGSTAFTDADPEHRRAKTAGPIPQRFCNDAYFESDVSVEGGLDVTGAGAFGGGSLVVDGEAGTVREFVILTDGGSHLSLRVTDIDRIQLSQFDPATSSFVRNLLDFNPASGFVTLPAGIAAATDGFYVGATRVVRAQQPAIANDASGAVNQATVNAILGALRTHGLIAT